MDLRSSWNHATDEIWRTLNAELWAITHNPWVVVQTVARERLKEVLGDAEFCAKVDELVRVRRQTAEQPANWEHAVTERWSSLKFGEVNVRSHDGQHTFEIQVSLDGLEPGFVKVQLYAEESPTQQVVQQDMSRLEANDNADSVWATYRSSVPATRPSSDFTARVVPNHSTVSVPLELNLIKWQR